MPKINILDSSVYNQISAGEVVENPASIVKELVENSIDAGAQNITVMIEDGGVKQICINDDGEGMEKDDLEKAIMPHATSKISTAKDLLTISTLGFRGEALASIAAVSHMEIKSKHILSDTAYFIKVRGGDIEDKGVTALNKGTSITINNLFYNTPARRNFLKSKKGEQSQITNLMAEIILANNTISISYFVDNKLIFDSSGKGLKAAIDCIYDTSVTENILPLDFDKKPYRISGYIAKPDTPAIKYNRKFQTFIINSRVIKDYLLSAVVQNAYGEKLMKRTFPLFVLDIIIPFDMVDVNVHPNKKQVRFSKDCKINSIIYNAAQEALRNDSIQVKKSYSFLSADSHEVFAKNQEPDDLFVNNSNQNQPQLQKHKKSDELDESLSSLSFTAPKILKNNSRLKENICSFDYSRQRNPHYKIIGQLFDTYILLQREDNLYIIDQHAAHERFLYDSYLQRLQKKPLDVQGLLIPYLYEAGDDYDYILQKKDILLDMGFEIESMGDGIIQVKTVPLQFSELNLDMFLYDLAKFRDNISDSSPIQEIIAKKACKNAIKGGVSLKDEDIDYVLESFFEKDVPLQCPHGRPVICKLSKKDIEKMFRRVL